MTHQKVLRDPRIHPVTLNVCVLLYVLSNPYTTILYMKQTNTFTSLLPGILTVLKHKKSCHVICTYILRNIGIWSISYQGLILGL